MPSANRPSHSLRLPLLQAFMPAAGLPSSCTDGSNGRPYLAFKLVGSIVGMNKASAAPTHLDAGYMSEGGRVLSATDACVLVAGGSAGQD